MLVGALDHVHEGESVAVQGGWQRHPRHGWRFVAERARVEEPASEPALLAYLGSVKHVGPRGAQWLLERDGPEHVLARVDRAPTARCARCRASGGADRRGGALVEDQGALRAVRLFLEENGVPAAVAARIPRLRPGRHRDAASDPYGLTKLDGIGFATADALAQALGTRPTPGRPTPACATRSTRPRATGTAIVPPRLAERAGACSPDADDAHRRAAAPRRRCIEGDRVFDPRCAPSRRVGAPRAHAERRRAAPAHGRHRAPDGELAPTDDEWAACRAVLETGWRSSPAAPEPARGRHARARRPAARRAAHASGCALRPEGGAAAGRDHGGPATTVHRLLESAPGEGSRGDEDPIPGTDVLIVDEASMLSVRLAEALSAPSGRDHVLLVGDVDQLAPVVPAACSTT